jgi:hypothetical protein
MTRPCEGVTPKTLSSTIMECSEGYHSCTSQETLCFVPIRGIQDQALEKEKMNMGVVLYSTLEGMYWILMVVLGSPS